MDWCNQRMPKILLARWNWKINKYELKSSRLNLTIQTPSIANIKFIKTYDAVKVRNDKQDFLHLVQKLIISSPILQNLFHTHYRD